MAKAASSALFEFERDATLADSERTIRELARWRGRESCAKVASNYHSAALNEAWAAAAIGTLLRKGERHTGIAWGHNSASKFDVRLFSKTAPGLVVTALADKLLLENGDEAAQLSALRHHIRSELKGYVADGHATERLIVEFDDERASALRDKSGAPGRIDWVAFNAITLRVRRELEVWWDEQTEAGIERPDRVLAEYRAAKVGLTDFVRELYENAYEHGRLGDDEQGPVPNLRFIRFRKVIEQRVHLEKRSKGAPQELVDFLMGSRGKTNKLATFLEVTISDFGMGIVDAFLMSLAGEKYREWTRSDVFAELLEKKISSKLDPAAGDGIPNALEAARNLRAFVSVRTNEFWRGRSFLDQGVEGALKDLSNEPLGPVAGTHWQILWAAPDL